MEDKEMERNLVCYLHTYSFCFPYPSQNIKQIFHEIAGINSFSGIPNMFSFYS